MYSPWWFKTKDCNITCAATNETVDDNWLCSLYTLVSQLNWHQDSNQFKYNIIQRKYIYHFNHTNHHTTHHNRFTALFTGPSGWAGDRRELLDFMVQGKTNRGRHTDHPARRHSIRTNQCPPPPSSHFLQAGCPSCHPTNSVKALKAASASKKNSQVTKQIPFADDTQHTRSRNTSHQHLRIKTTVKIND